MKNICLATSLFFLSLTAYSQAEDNLPQTQTIEENQNFENFTSYDEQLESLYSILGALHSLSNICFHKNQQWRDFAQSLSLSENLNSMRRAKLFSAFNTSYRTLTTTYDSCTASAQQAYEIYKKQGKEQTENLLSKLAYNED